jgi:flagellar motor component MotA
VLSIQSGANPRMVNDLLRSYLPPGAPEPSKANEERKSA